MLLKYCLLLKNVVCITVNMVLTLYYNSYSAPCRCVLVTIHAIGLENNVEIKDIDLMAGDQLKPDFLKINPLHTIPTLQDNSFNIFESSAINIYLVEKYAKDDTLYPKDLQKRALVDQMLYFTSGTLMQKWRAVVVPLFLKQSRTISEQAKNGIKEIYNYLETILKSRTYVASNDNLTLADLQLCCWLTTTNILIPIDEEEYPKVTNWIKEVQSIYFFNVVNEPGLEKFKGFVKNLTDL